jgi:hypothetical protein
MLTPSRRMLMPVYLLIFLPFLLVLVLLLSSWLLG